MASKNRKHSNQKFAVVSLPQLFAATLEDGVTIFTEPQGFGVSQFEGDKFAQLLTWEGEHPWRLVLEAHSGDKNLCQLYIRVSNGLYKLDRTSNRGADAAFKHHDEYVRRLAHEAVKAAEDKAIREAQEREKHALYGLEARFHMTTQRERSAQEQRRG